MGNKKLDDIRQSFSENTSCHGLGLIYASTNKFQRAFWCLLTIAVMAFLIFQLTIRIQEYAEYKTTTSLSEIYIDELDFPAITVCNFNNFFGIDSQSERDAILQLSRAKSPVRMDQIEMDKIKYFDNVYGGSIRNYSIAKGWQVNNETLIWCYSGESNCNWNNFTYSITDLGKCWTIRNQDKTKRAGSKHGVSMVFDIQQSSYTEDVTNGNWEAGIKVQVHPWNEEPEVDQLGKAVPVGNMAFISMHKTQQKIMHRPWGECDPGTQELDRYSHYSRSNCFSECLQKYLNDNCKCRLYLFNDSYSLRECNPRETVDCLANFRTNAQESFTLTDCECTPPCDSVRYDTSVSYATIPNAAVYDDVAAYLTKLDDVRENLVGVTIFYEKMSYTKHEENKAITESGLLGDLGGQLGLCVGISFVTIFEFVQFFVMCCVEGAVAKKQRHKQEPEVAHEIGMALPLPELP